MRVLVFTLMLAAANTLGGAVSAGKKTPVNKETIIGVWKATVPDNKDRLELGVFTFRPDGKFALERDHFLDLPKGTYAVDEGTLKFTVTYAADGAPLEKGPWPVKLQSFSEKEFVLELQDPNERIHFARVAIPQGAWQAVEEDRKRLQGKWEYVGTETDGKLVKDKESGQTLTFQGEKILQEGAEEYGILTLSANRKFKAIQFRFINGEGLANLGAYELKGDTLRICRDPERAFPVEFKTKGTKNYIEEFKRVSRKD
jgi:uncharacterized protein (TIGR03067 family)